MHSSGFRIVVFVVLYFLSSLPWWMVRQYLLIIPLNSPRRHHSALVVCIFPFVVDRHPSVMALDISHEIEAHWTRSTGYTWRLDEETFHFVCLHVRTPIELCAKMKIHFPDTCFAWSPRRSLWNFLSIQEKQLSTDLNWAKWRDSRLNLHTRVRTRVRANFQIAVPTCTVSKRLDWHTFKRPML